MEIFNSWSSDHLLFYQGAYSWIGGSYQEECDRNLPLSATSVTFYLEVVALESPAFNN